MAPGSDSPRAPHAGIVMRAAWRTSGIAARQPPRGPRSRPSACRRARRSRPAAAWSPPPPRRAGGRAEAARLARPGGRGRGAGQRSRSRRRPRPPLNWLTAAAGAAAWPPLSARGRRAAAHRAAGGNDKRGSAWRPAVAPGSDRRSRRRRPTPYAVYHEDNQPAPPAPRERHQRHRGRRAAARLEHLLNDSGNINKAL